MDFSMAENTTRTNKNGQNAHYNITVWFNGWMVIIRE